MTRPSDQLPTVGLLHPGEMGASVGAAARAAGARVLWASSGRSEATARRAAAAGLEDVGTVAALVATSEVVLSVCPPASARQVAREVIGHGFRGLFVDANAVSPSTAREIGALVASGGARLVDGGIVGPPARARGTTRLYLSGAGADGVARLFAESALEALVLPGEAGAASALKMAYAAYTKGTTALLMAIRALAIREGVDEALVAEWGRSQPDVPGRCESGVRGSAGKAWRFTGEMDEIAATFAEAKLPDGFHRAASEVYARLAEYKDAATPPTVAEAAATLLEG